MKISMFVATAVWAQGPLSLGQLALAVEKGCGILAGFSYIDIIDK